MKSFSLLVILICFCSAGVAVTGVMCGITHSTNADRNVILNTIPYDKLPNAKDSQEHNKRLTNWSYVFNILLCTVLCINTALFCVNLAWVRSLMKKE